MRRYRHRARVHEPSLVPLADMLTNTVGIMVFILIFTVLTAGGVVLAKRLPRERTTEARPVHFFCAGGRVLPLRSGDLIEEFLQPLGRPTSFYAVAGWLRRFNERRVEDDYFVVTGDGDANYTDWGLGRSVSLNLAAVCTPKEGRGETPAELKREDSPFRQLLKASQPSKQFIHFFVRPDSLEAFTAARDAAAAAGFDTGWLPFEQGQPVRFGLTGGGREAKVL
jgi:hypothetical protein